MAVWKLTGTASREAVETALAAQADAADWDGEVTVSANEVDRDDWAIEAWYARKPTARDRRALAALFDGDAPELSAEKLPDTDWVSLSQQGTPPIRAGRFHVHTPDFSPLRENGIVDFTIPAAQAFGTGQHETTAGCLAMLDRMRTEGVIVRNLADIGCGTGLLAFAALSLWPRALCIASDIDPVCEDIIAGNALANSIAVGGRPGEVVPLVAAGTDHPVIAARAPFDLLVANILAGPLIELAPDFADHVAPGGHLVLAGLLTTQERDVRRATTRAGFRLARRMVRGEWSILWLRRRTVR